MSGASQDCGTVRNAGRGRMPPGSGIGDREAGRGFAFRGRATLLRDRPFSPAPRALTKAGAKPVPAPDRTARGPLM